MVLVGLLWLVCKNSDMDKLICFVLLYVKHYEHCGNQVKQCKLVGITGLAVSMHPKAQFVETAINK